MYDQIDEFFVDQIIQSSVSFVSFVLWIQMFTDMFKTPVGLIIQMHHKNKWCKQRV